MINIDLENKCEVLNCENPFDFLIGQNKYCLTHCPDDKYEITVKKLCKYCDIKENSKYICPDCQKITNKIEWAIGRYLRKTIDTPFEYNSSKMLQVCSKKRPDIFFDLLFHVVIVEIDERQHRSYEDSCECSRINEIVNGIGGKAVIIIRFNPDITLHQGKKLNLQLVDKLLLIVETIKKEIICPYRSFLVKQIQLYYDDSGNFDEYKALKEEDITRYVAI